MIIDLEKEELASKLRSSYFEFKKFFYPLLTGRHYIISRPTSRESHQVIVAKALVRAFLLEILRLMINVHPGSGKSTDLSLFVAWSFTIFPDCRFLYVSYSKDLSARHTETIKRIMQLPAYKFLFDVHIRHDSRGKEFFQTTAGGIVAAAGSSGTVTGLDAGLPGLDRFSGALIIDDPIKPSEAVSDKIREGVIENYRETLQQRLRSDRVPIIFIGQRVHEADLCDYLLKGKDGHEWDSIILKSIDEAGHAMYPEVISLETLLIKQEHDKYVFASQYQQDPLPAGGALFNRDNFVILPEEPKFLTTFITADTAETDKSWNDATVFSFFGVYEIETLGRKTGQFGLHWIDCAEMRIEPKDLKDAFLDFYGTCSLHPKPPLMAAIEKKSTGVTLVSVLKELRGMQIREIERTSSSGSKAQRFIELQPYISSKYISFTEHARHINLCIDHVVKITPNGSHRHDDICDTLADGIKIALIEKTIYNGVNISVSRKQVADALNKNLRTKLELGRIRYGNSESSYRSS